MYLGACVLWLSLAWGSLPRLFSYSLTPLPILGERLWGEAACAQVPGPLERSVGPQHVGFLGGGFAVHWVLCRDPGHFSLHMSEEPRCSQLQQTRIFKPVNPSNSK